MALGTPHRSILVWLVLSLAAPGVTRVQATAEPSIQPSSKPPAAAMEAAMEADDEEATRLKYRPIVGVSLLAGAIASATLPRAINEAPLCRWCDGARPNVIDRWARNARWEHPCAAARLSYWSLGVASIVALGPMSHESSRREWLVNAGALFDSAAVTVMATQVVKYAVRRERPADNPCLAANYAERDRNLSFFSGHTAVAFALASSARTTSMLRGHSHPNWLFLSGAAAVLTGHFRVAGDRHHLTDVLAGAGVGILIGTWVPKHLHRPKATVADPVPFATKTPWRGGPPFIGVSKSVENRGQRFLIHVGKGPGKSLQFGLSF